MERSLRSITKHFPNHALPCPFKLSVRYLSQGETFSSHFPSVFSKLDVHTILLRVQEGAQASLGTKKTHKELRTILSVVGKGSSPWALCHTMRRCIRFPATRRPFSSNLHNFLQVVAACGTHCSDTEMVP